MAEARIKLVTRGDDAGSSHSANRAVRDAFEKGILRNAGLQVPGHTFDEAAEMLGGLKGLCLGLHATVCCEWNQVAWRPVVGAAKAPSIVRADGTFYQDTGELWKRRPSNDEILAELKAQLDKARAKGLKIEYMDEHMVFGWFHGLQERLHAFAKAEGLIYGHGVLAGLPDVKGEFADLAERLIAQLRAAAPGKTYLVVTHPCYDDEEMRGCTYGQEPPCKIARDRDADRRMYMDERVIAYCRAAGVALTRFSDL